MIESGFCDTTEDRKLELAFINKHRKVHLLNEATSVELAKGLERISEIAERLLLLKEQR
jgi:hypothetical protein